MSEPEQGDLFADETGSENTAGATTGNAAPPRLFLDWSRSLLDHAVAHLASDWEDGVLDLGDLLVIVPTQHAGRRLREALAIHTAGKGAVIPPLTVEPGFLVSAERLPSADNVAGAAETLLAWIDALRSLDTRRFRDLFPVDPVERSFSWALHTATHLLQLRHTLAEAGLLISGAADILGAAGIEPRRWRQLADLEQSALENLADRGLLDPVTSRIEAARKAPLPAGIQRLLILGVADPLPLAIEALTRHAAAVPAEILVYAPAEFKEAFDDWGRPLTLAWAERPIDIPGDEKALHPASTPESQAAKVLDLLAPYDNEAAPRSLAICLADPALTPTLRKAFESRDLGAYDPAGLKLEHHEIYYLLSTFAELSQGRSMTAFAELLRNPDLAGALRSEFEKESPISHEHLLRSFDDLQAEHLPETIDDAASLIGSRDTAPAKILNHVLQLLDDLEKNNLDEVLLAFLEFAYSLRRFRADQPDYRRCQDVARLLEEHLHASAHASADSLSNAERLELLLHLLRSGALYPERESSDVDLQGWLELLWEDAPHLVLTGFNDGSVPAAVVGDPYLPNTALTTLGLRGNDHWLARDAYYLTAILESRREAGRTDIVFGRLAADSTPLRPSRLLFRCPDTDLPARALQLFHGSESDHREDAPAAWTRTWQLKPPALPETATFTEKLSVTAFRSYLACPTRFYLSRGLRMESVEVDKMELNAMDFGNLCHAILQQFGNHETLRDSSDAEEIAAYLTGEAETFVTRRYGKEHSVPVMIQLEAARQRLSWAAEKQAELRRAGWKIEVAEWDLRDTEAWKIGETAIHGIIDRIDRHEETGALRVIDYKTTSKPLSPPDAHLSAFGRKEDPADWPDWAKTEDPAGKPCAWVDLQLPLYLHATRARYPGAAEADISCAYFNLPRAVAETDLLPWEDLDARLLDAALACARGVIDAIGKKEFWPPSEAAPFDDFETLAAGDLADAIDEKHFQKIITS